MCYTIRPQWSPFDVAIGTKTNKTNNPTPDLSDRYVAGTF